MLITLSNGKSINIGDFVRNLDKSKKYSNLDLAGELGVELREVKVGELRKILKEEFESLGWVRGTTGRERVYEYQWEKSVQKIHYHPAVIVGKRDRISVQKLKKRYGYSTKSWEIYTEEELSPYGYEMSNGEIKQVMTETWEEFVERNKKTIDRVIKTPKVETLKELWQQTITIGGENQYPNMPEKYTKAQKKKIIELDDQYDQSEWIKGKGLFETNMEQLLDIHSTRQGACYYFRDTTDEAFMVAVAEYLREPDLQPRRAIATKENGFNSGRANILVKQTQELIDMIAYFWDDIQERRTSIPDRVYEKAHDCLSSAIQVYSNSYNGDLVHDISFRRYRPQLIEHVPQVNLEEQTKEAEKDQPLTLSQKFQKYQEAQRHVQ